MEHLKMLARACDSIGSPTTTPDGSSSPHNGGGGGAQKKAHHQHHSTTLNNGNSAAHKAVGMANGKVSNGSSHRHSNNSGTANGHAVLNGGHKSTSSLNSASTPVSSSSSAGGNKRKLEDGGSGAPAKRSPPGTANGGVKQDTSPTAALSSMVNNLLSASGCLGPLGQSHSATASNQSTPNNSSSKFQLSHANNVAMHQPQPTSTTSASMGMFSPTSSASNQLQFQHQQQQQAMAMAAAMGQLNPLMLNYFAGMLMGGGQQPQMAPVAMPPPQMPHQSMPHMNGVLPTSQGMTGNGGSPQQQQMLAAAMAQHQLQQQLMMAAAAMPSGNGMGMMSLPGSMSPSILSQSFGAAANAPSGPSIQAMLMAAACGQQRAFTCTYHVVSPHGAGTTVCGRQFLSDSELMAHFRQQHLPQPLPASGVGVQQPSPSPRTQQPAVKSPKAQAMSHKPRHSVPAAVKSPLTQHQQPSAFAPPTPQQQPSQMSFSQQAMQTPFGAIPPWLAASLPMPWGGMMAPTQMPPMNATMGYHPQSGNQLISALPPSSLPLPPTSNATSAASSTAKSSAGTAGHSSGQSSSAGSAKHSPKGGSGGGVTGAAAVKAPTPTTQMAQSQNPSALYQQQQHQHQAALLQQQFYEQQMAALTAAAASAYGFLPSAGPGVSQVSLQGPGPTGLLQAAAMTQPPQPSPAVQPLTSSSVPLSAPPMGNGSKLEVVDSGFSSATGAGRSQSASSTPAATTANEASLTLSEKGDNGTAAPAEGALIDVGGGGAAAMEASMLAPQKSI